MTEKEIDVIQKELGETLYDDIYQYCNEIVHEVGYTFMALDHEVGLDRLSKEFPKVSRQNLMKLLIFAEGDVN